MAKFSDTFEAISLSLFLSLSMNIALKQALRKIVVFGKSSALFDGTFYIHVNNVLQT